MKIIKNFTIDYLLQDTFPGFILEHTLHNLRKSDMRLAMGGEIESSPERFLQVMGRFQKVFLDLFKDSQTLWGILIFYSGRNLENTIPKGFNDLIYKCGFKISKNKPVQMKKILEEPLEAEDPKLYKYIYALEIAPKFENFLPIIWAIGGNEIGIRPTAELDAFIFDPKGIILNLYDDRGLDIFINDHDKLKTLRKDYKDWLS